MKIHAVFSTKIISYGQGKSPAIVLIVLGQASNLFLCDGWKEQSLSKDAAVLPNILPHLQLEFDGEGSMEADLQMSIEIKKWRFFSSCLFRKFSGLHRKYH